MLATCALHILRTVLQTGGQSSCRMAFHTTFMHMMRSAQHAHYVFSGASQQPEFCGLDLTPARYCRHHYWVMCSAITGRSISPCGIPGRWYRYWPVMVLELSGPT